MEELIDARLTANDVSTTLLKLGLSVAVELISLFAGSNPVTASTLT